jgi:hypothetical protein
MSAATNPNLEVRMPLITTEFPETHLQCSLRGRIPHDHGQWTMALVTIPEGSDHPVVLGRTGDCHGCLDDLKFVAEQIEAPIPLEIIATQDVDGDFCQCGPCKFITGLVWNPVLLDNDPDFISFDLSPLHHD